MRFNERKNRIQRLNVSCPTAKHRNDTTEPIRRHDDTVTEPDDDLFPGKPNRVVRFEGKLRVGVEESTADASIKSQHPLVEIE